MYIDAAIVSNPYKQANHMSLQGKVAIVTGAGRVRCILPHPLESLLIPPPGYWCWNRGSTRKRRSKRRH